LKYNEIIHVNEKFIPVFDLENEESDQYWPLFIPNDKFRDILSSVIDSLNVKNQRNPVWLQGTYGTGKTHATSVIKHLLCDKTLPDYDLENNQLSAKLDTFREKTNVFPVVLKGTSTIGESQGFELTIQSAVKKALEKSNMRVAVPSEFEHMADIIVKYPLEDNDMKGTNLEFCSHDEILHRLKNEEIDVLRDVENIYKSNGLSTFTHDNIVDWLTEVRNKLNEEYGIDYLMIFWDEFTGALNMLNVEDILLQIQNIAEAKNKGISLFIVSHRTRSTQVNINQEIIDKIMDRFERKYYSMEPVATYELMERSIGKESEWESVKNKYVDIISPLIEKISVNDGPKVKHALENLYPIHPYTAFLATFIAQEIGSTERSIFKFLHDDIDYGFRSFINTFNIDERYFLTSDYLWDFFFDDFDQSEDEKINSAVKKYKLHYDSFKDMDEEYLVILKVILLLNVLYKIADVGKGSLAIPSEENIANVFIGSIYQDKVDPVLNYIDENGIINKTEGLFELTTNTLPPEQVSAEVRKLRNSVKLKDLLSTKLMREIKKEFSGKILREIEIEIKDADISESRFINDLEKEMFKKSGYLHMMLFLCKTNEEFISINKIIKSVHDKDLLNNIIVVVSQAVLGEDNFDKYLDSKARARVSQTHNYTEDISLHNKRADDTISKWVKDIKRKTVSYYLNNQEGNLPLKNFIKYVNSDLSKSIFFHGLENISETLNNRNLWPEVKAKNQAEKFITASTLTELTDSLSGVDKQSVSIFGDNNNGFIVDENLNLKTTVSDKHPIKILQDFVDESLDNAQSAGKFNLGVRLGSLIDPPYGLYPNKLNIAAFAFVLRNYVDKLYDTKGNSIDETKMRNLVMAIFEFWSKGKQKQDLYIRFGSENEKKLGELINDIFELDLDSNNRAISTVRWKLREWIKINKSPLWLFKYSTINEENHSLSAAIDALFAFLKPKDNNLPDNIIQECYENIKPVKMDLKLSFKENPTNLFNKFLDEFDKEFTSSEVTEIKEHLDNTMPEEVYDWDENKVRTEIYKWLISPDPVVRKNPNMAVSVEDNSVIVSLDKDATGKVLVNVAGNGYYAKIINGKAVVNVTGLEEDTIYVATVSYDGDDKFLDANATVKFKIESIHLNPHMEVSVEGGSVIVSLDKDATGNVLVNVADKGYFAKIKDGNAIVDVTDLKGGKTYVADVTYEGDDNFDKAETNIQIKIELVDSNMDVFVEGNSINVSLDKEATGDILVNVDNRQFSSKVIDGNANITVKGLEGGNAYSATVSYEGDNKFAKSKINVTLEIESAIDTEEIIKIKETDAILLKDALINALNDNEEITPKILVKYLENIDNDNL
jgi:hypothetical protein